MFECRGTFSIFIAHPPKWYLFEAWIPKEAVSKGLIDESGAANAGGDVEQQVGSFCVWLITGGVDINCSMSLFFLTNFNGSIKLLCATCVWEHFSSWTHIFNLFYPQAGNIQSECVDWTKKILLNPCLNGCFIQTLVNSREVELKQLSDATRQRQVSAYGSWECF